MFTRHLKTKRSWVFLTLALVLGLFPMIGSFVTTVETDALEVGSIAPVPDMSSIAEQKQREYEEQELKIRREQHEQSIHEYRAIRERPLSDKTMHGEDVIEMSSESPTVDTVPPPTPDVSATDNTTALAIEPTLYDRLRDVMYWMVKNWMTVFGFFNTLVFGWRFLHWRKEEMNPVFVEVFIGQNDLEKMPWRSRVKMMYHSWFDTRLALRYRLRKDSKWSIYSSTVTVMESLLIKRAFMIINPDNDSWGRIRGHIASFEPKTLIDDDGENEPHPTIYPLREHYASVSNADKIEFKDWLVNVYALTVKEAILQLHDDEYAIVLCTLTEDGIIDVYTLYSNTAPIPNTLEGFEILIAQFRTTHFSKTNDNHIDAIYVVYPEF